MEQTVVTSKAFLAPRYALTGGLLSDRKDIDHHDPEFKRQVDQLDITHIDERPLISVFFFS